MLQCNMDLDTRKSRRLSRFAAKSTLKSDLEGGSKALKRGARSQPWADRQSFV